MVLFFFFLMIRRPPRSTHCISSAASDVYKRQFQYFPHFSFASFCTSSSPHLHSYVFHLTPSSLLLSLVSFSPIPVNSYPFLSLPPFFIHFFLSRFFLHAFIFVVCFLIFSSLQFCFFLYFKFSTPPLLCFPPHSFFTSSFSCLFFTHPCQLLSFSFPPPFLYSCLLYTSPSPRDQA
eukprot:TRINITY_DN28025_c0_g1_i1.p3 TRINITY_DN28025_c0_g1~~TRINITY_DN28025_c0_g1_i1.p3  ORF type:complete len:177 (+),score=12.17 TRINITY_DN28025_c0_g1_i1:67-597(+)